MHMDAEPALQHLLAQYQFVLQVVQAKHPRAVAAQSAVVRGFSECLVDAALFGHGRASSEPHLAKCWQLWDELLTAFPESLASYKQAVAFFVPLKQVRY